MKLNDLADCFIGKEQESTTHKEQGVTAEIIEPGLLAWDFLDSLNADFVRDAVVNYFYFTRSMVSRSNLYRNSVLVSRISKVSRERSVYDTLFILMESYRTLLRQMVSTFVTPLMVSIGIVFVVLQAAILSSSVKARASFIGKVFVSMDFGFRKFFFELFEEG